MLCNACRLICASSFLLAATNVTWSQEEETERWYQVELLIYSHEQVSGNEQWPPLPQLSYPEAARFLVDPDLMEMNLFRQTAERAESRNDEFGRQIITLFAPADPELQDLPAEPETRTALVPGEPNSPAVPADPNVPEDPNDPIPDPTTPSPFVVLPRFDQEFNDVARRLSRSGRHDVLFHQAWRQPMLDKATSLPIILDRSGDNLSWPRLQGSIKLYLSRYLHLQTNLWLNTDGYYLPGQWRMPPPPLGPASLIVEQPEPADLLDPDTPSEESTWLPLDEEPSAEPPWSTETERDEELDSDSDAVLEVDPGPLYQFRHAVTFQQERRMRSEEIHYLDHPMLGLVIQIRPLDEETLRILAREEAGLPPLEAELTETDQPWAP